MTVSSTQNRNDYTVSSGTASYPYTYRIFKDADLVLTVRSPVGVESRLTLGVHYSVTGAGSRSGGAVILVSPATYAGYALAVRRVLVLTQETSIRNQGAFYPELHEDVFDRMGMVDQQQQEQIDRAIKANETDLPVDMTLPRASARANRYLSFDASGRPVATTFDLDAVANASTSALNAAAAAALSEASAAGHDASALAAKQSAIDSAQSAAAQSAIVAAQVAAVAPTVVQFIGDGVATTFALPANPGSENNVVATVNGLTIQHDQFSVTSGAIIFATPPAAPGVPGQPNIEVRINAGTAIQLTSMADALFLANGTGAVLRGAQDKLREHGVSPTDFGATTALIDIGPMLQQAANALMLTGGVLAIPPGTWRVTSADIVLYPNTEVRFAAGAVIDMSGAPSSAALFVAAGSKGAAYALSANAVKAALTASLSPANLAAAGIVAGDWVKVASNAVMDPARTSSKLGELIQVDSVNAGTGVVTFKTPLADAYATADAATITRVALAQGVKVTGAGKIVGGVSGTSHQGVSMTLCYRPFVGDGMAFESVNDRAIYFADCVQPRAHRVSFENALHATTAYGLSVADASCDGMFTQLASRNVRHLFTTNNSSAGGIPRRHIVSGWSAKQSAKSTGGAGGDSIDTHAAAEDIHIWNGESHGSSGAGVNMECRSGSIMNVFVYDSAGTGVVVWNWTNRPGDHVLSNVHTYRTGNYGVTVQPRGAAQDRLTMSNVGSVDSFTTGIKIDGTLMPLSNVSLSTLSAQRSTSTNPIISIDGVSGGALCGVMSNPSRLGSEALRLTDCTDFLLMGLAAIMPAANTAAAVRVMATTAGSSKNITISACRTKDPSPVSSYGVRVDSNPQNITVDDNNDMRQATTPITLSGGTSGNRGGYHYGSLVYDPASLVDGAGVTVTIPVLGADPGDLTQATFSVNLAGVILSAWVSANDVVSVRFQNETGAMVDLASGTLKVVAYKI